MATLDELQNALIKADAAGDSAGAQMLADHIREINSAGQAQTPVAPERTWGDTLTEAALNVPASTANMLGGVASAVMHPIDTAGAIGNLAAGELSKVLPEKVSSFIDQFDPNPAAGLKAKQTAEAFNDIYRQGYGSEAGFKERLATDPMAVVGDLSTVLTGGGAAASKLGALGNLSKAQQLGAALSQAGNVTNPLSLIPKVAGSTANIAGKAAAQALGSPLMTGVGGQTVKTAFQSGKDFNPDFIKNLSGRVPIDDVLSTAKQNLNAMNEAKAQAYQSGMIDISKDKTILNFNGIDNAISRAAEKGSYGGQIVNPKAFDAVQEAKAAVDQWKNGDPSLFATPQGMDKLKQRIGAIEESIPFEQKRARAAVGEIYNSVKNEISQQAPTYAKTMGEYSDASKQIDEIRKTLSLGPTAQADTAIRKLQSLTRNNVNANYGRRAELADMLSKQGGKDIMPALAGQSMNDWFGRGMGSHIGTGAITASALAANPYASLLLPLQSPKLVGAGANALGYIAGAPGKAFSAIPGSSMLTNNADKARALALLLEQSQQGNP